MIYLQTIILAIIQGLTEFLPISSSGHLIIITELFNWQDLGLAFDITLHWGTLVAVIVYFRHDLINIIKLSFSSKNHPPKNGIYYDKLFINIILASIPIAIIGFVFKDQISTGLRTPFIVAINLIIFAVLLYVSDKFSEKKNINMKNWQAILIGIAQSIAIIPGVSRSGVTIIMARFQKIKKVDAARFSFLLSIPAIFGAGLLELPEIIKNGDLNYASLFIGFLISFIAGYLSIKLLLTWISKHSFKPFSIYRIILALLILILMK